MESDQQRKKANQLKMAAVLVLVALFCIALIVAQKFSLAEVERAAKPGFEGKMERSRTPISRVPPPDSSAEEAGRAAASPGTKASGPRSEPTAQPQDVPTNPGQAVVRVATDQPQQTGLPVPVSSTGQHVGGTIFGKVTLKGVPPPEKPINAVLQDPGCSKILTNIPMTRFYVVGQDGGLGDVFVYIKEGVRRGPQPLAEPVLINQTCCEYVPYVVGLQTGQKLRVRNSDPVLHNVHSTPNVAGNKERNLAQMPKAPDIEFTFDKPELFLRFKCDVHPWMFAYVCVVDHPFFAVTGPDGSFSIERLSEGNYVIEAIHRKAGHATQEISIRDSREIVNVNFEFQPQ